MIRIAVAMIASGLAATAMIGQAAAQAPTIGGLYAAEGTNPGGGSYGGVAEIRGTSGGQCAIVWRLRNTPPTDGFCMRQGDVFVAAYRLGDAIGLAIYRLGPSGALDGTWSIAGRQGVGTERLVPRER